MHTFTELLFLWQADKFTLTEMSELLPQAVVVFRERAARLDYKIMAMAASEQVEWRAEDALDVGLQEVTIPVIYDYLSAYRAVNHLLEQFMLMELKFIKLERDYERLAQELDCTNSQWN
jgi:hypothetical protein